MFGPSAVDLYRSHVLDSPGGPGDPLGPALSAGPVRSAALIAAVLGLLVVQPCAFLARALGKPDGTMAGRTWMETMTPTWAAGTCYAAVLAGGSGTVVWLHLLQVRLLCFCCAGVERVRASSCWVWKGGGVVFLVRALFPRPERRYRQRETAEVNAVCFRSARGSGLSVFFFSDGLEMEAEGVLQGCLFVRRVHSF